MGVLDISSRDISKLSEDGLQRLVALLCEAELEACVLPPKFVVWTDNTKAGDGGVDVRVSTESRLGECGFIPKGQTIFQVKQSKVPPSDIRREMHDKRCPQKLRDAIAANFKAGGAYVIVGGKAAVGDGGINKRKEEMRKVAREAMPDIDPRNLCVDFYGGDRIAQWVRRHASVALRLREELEMPVGWQHYEDGKDWSAPRQRISGKDEYVVGDDIFLVDKRRGKKLSLCEGINSIRETVRGGNFAVRIVGLSGMGKTRLVRALFDSTIGELPLKKHEAIYGDSGAEVKPSPVAFARTLVAEGRPVVLIVDNCDKEKHDELADICAKSAVKLITVEFDIRDHKPEGTDVFQLECESRQVVEELIYRRYPGVHENNRCRIAKLCGGNPRMGLILAEGAVDTGDLADLSDVLFVDRLLWQNNEQDKALKQTAEVCSLVYSFGVGGKNKEELAVLAKFAGRDAADMRFDVAELVRRGIAQQRGNMRAILPEALARYFAANALAAIDNDDILRAVMSKGRKRLLQSFSHRLGYMHENKHAQKIAEKWLAPGGFLDAQGKYPSMLQTAVLENIAPALPKNTLEFIMRIADSGALSADFPHLEEYARLLFHLAYDKDLFNDAAGLLVRIALLASDYHTSEDAQSVLCTLFCYSLSGTHAPFSQRMAFVEKMTEADDRKEWQLGLKLLESTMTRSRSNSGLLLAGFGARSRDFGRNIRGAEAREWFGAFIDHTAKLAISGKPVAQEALHLLAEQFRELWSSGLEKELTAAADKIAAHDEQHEMAIAVLEAIRYDGDEMKPESLAQLQKIQKSLIPKEYDIRGRFKMFFVADSKGHHLLSNTDMDGQDITPAKAEEYARKMGVDIMRSASDFKALLPDMLTASHHSLSQLGRGIADGCDGNYQSVWGDFREHLRVIPKDKFNVSVPAGFVSGVAKKSQSDAIDILNRSVKDDALAPFYLHLEPFTERLEGAKCRIKQSIGLGKVPPHKYKFLAWGRSHSAFNDADLAEIIRLITPLSGGVDAAVEILSMRFYDIREGQYTPDDSIRKCGREVVLGVDFSARDGSGMKSHSAGRIVDVCFSPPGAEEDRKQLRRTLAREIKRGNLSGNHKILKLLAKWDPEGFLDDFLIVDDAYNLHPLRGPVGDIAEDVIIDWCEQKPGERCPLAAFVVRFFQEPQGEDRTLTSVARRLVGMIDDDHDKMKVLNNLWRGGNSRSCFVGSPVQMLEERLALFVNLQRDGNPAVAEWAQQRAEGTKKNIQQEKLREEEDVSSEPEFERDRF